MATTAQNTEARQVRDDHLLRTARFHVAVVIRKADHGVGIADVDPLRVRTQWIESDAERPLQAGGEGLYLFGFSVFGYSMKHFYFSRLALGQENIAIGCGSDQPRVLEV